MNEEGLAAWYLIGACLTMAAWTLIFQAFGGTWVTFAGGLLVFIAYVFGPFLVNRILEMAPTRPRDRD